MHRGNKLLLCLLQDIIFSFPVRCSGGKWEIVQGLKIDEFSAQKIKATGDDAAFASPRAASCKPLSYRQLQQQGLAKLGNTAVMYLLHICWQPWCTA